LSQYRSLLYQIDLKQPFTQDFIRANVSKVIQETYRSEENPQVRYGHMLANDYEFILYGGVMDDSDSIVYPDENWALAKDIYPNNGISLPESGRWRKVQLDGVIRYIADGAYVNVPSENLSFVFGGSRVSLLNFSTHQMLNINIGRNLGRNTRQWAARGVCAQQTELTADLSRSQEYGERDVDKQNIAKDSSGTDWWRVSVATNRPERDAACFRRHHAGSKHVHGT